MGEVIIGIALLLLSVMVYIQSGAFIEAGIIDAVGAGFFPRIIAVPMGLLAVSLLVIKTKELIQRETKDKRCFRAVVSDFFEKILYRYRYVFIATTAFSLYVVLMNYFGFRLTTFLFIFITGWLIGPKKKKNALPIALVAVVVTFGTHYFFQNFLYVRFPRGIFF